MAPKKPKAKVLAVGQKEKKIAQATEKISVILRGMYANGASQAYAIRLVRACYQDYIN